MPIMRLSEVKTCYTTDGIENPEGWVIREKVCDDGKCRGFEYGTYLNNDIFVSVPIHVNIKPSLIKIESKNNNYNYYLPPKNFSDMKVSLSTYESKSGKSTPIIVKTPENKSESFIVCYSFEVPTIANSIVDIRTSQSFKILRKYIDKDRKNFAIIGVYTNIKCINPKVTFYIDYGIVGESTTKYITKTVVFDKSTNMINLYTDEASCQGLSTKFIKFPMMTIRNKNAKTKNEDADIKEEEETVKNGI